MSTMDSDGVIKALREKLGCEAEQILDRVDTLLNFKGGFGWAVTQVMEGKKIAREGWNGKNMWVCMIHPGNAAHRGFAMQPCLGLKTANGNMQPGWNASQADMLAEDWIVLD